MYLSDPCEIYCDQCTYEAEKEGKPKKKHQQRQTTFTDKVLGISRRKKELEECESR